MADRRASVVHVAGIVTAVEALAVSVLPSNVTSAGSVKVTDGGRSAGVKDLNKSKKPWHNGALFHFRSRPPGKAYCFQRRHRKRIAPCDPKRDRSGPYGFISVNYPTASSVTWAFCQPISKVESNEGETASRQL